MRREEMLKKLTKANADSEELSFLPEKPRHY